jgi:hypothetical protein
MMNDPHVVSLTYKIVAGEGSEFENPQPLKHEWNSFLFKLENGTLTVTPEDHFSTAEDARLVVDRYLEAWELDHALKNGRRNVRFKYESAEVIDRNPPQPGNTLFVYTGDIVLVSGVHSVTKQGWSRYPDPPSDFASVPPDAETLWNRYEGYTQKREPLPGMAYFCVTVIEAGPERPRHHSKKRQAAADKYRVEYEVIDKLAELSSTRGDANTARKHGAVPLSESEKAWMEAAVKAITRRVAELHSTPDPTTLPEITMKDLPSL